MNLLLADDDGLYRRVLERALTEWGYRVQAVCDGAAAWEALRAEGAPRLALLDWMMPGLDGPEVCRRARALPTAEPPYLILLTSRESKEDIVAGLQSGANDYVTKPFDRAELQARLEVGRNVLGLRASLAARVRELEQALAQVKQLQGLLPICSYCKKIRDDKNYWQQVESYFCQHAEVTFSHGICPDCWQRVLRPQLQKMGQNPPELPPS
ncbi:MAG TPA: response regulator transcription factor [Gemmataceae bacterium]|nr:response regulator transcription factor [Gemmataceae bacterium]